MRGAALILLLACGGASESAPDQSRSAGLREASLTEGQRVAVYQAAVRASFDVNPDLVLLLHPIQLPEGAGLEGGTPLPEALGSALARAGVVRGMCTPAHSNDQRAPTCPFERSGYVIRATPIFQAGGDTLRMNFRSELFAASGGAGQEPFAFEMAYKVIPRSDGGFRVAAEGRVREKEGGA